MSSSWFIVGAGYTGARLARRLVGEGEDVHLSRRTTDGAQDIATQVGARGVRADLTEPATLLDIFPPSCIIVVLAPPGAAPADEMRALLAGLAHAEPIKLVYVSSTAVYAPAHGAWVDESWPLEPATRAGHARLAAEAALTESGEHRHATAILRAAGIYGPNRGVVSRLRAGTYRIIGDGRAHVSRIHVTDLVDAIIRAGRSPTATGVFNVADDDPAPVGDVADALAAKLGVPPPPRVPASGVDPEIAGMLTADRRIANARMKAELGVVLRYPSWRDAPSE